MEAQEKISDKVAEPVEMSNSIETSAVGTERGHDSQTAEDSGENSNDSFSQKGNGTMAGNNSSDKSCDKVGAEGSGDTSDVNDTERSQNNRGNEQNKQTSYSSGTLKEKLDSLGLKSDYWCMKLKTKLGITDSTQLEHLTSEDLQKLKPFRYNWEERALRKLIQKHEDTTSNDKNQENSMQQVIDAVQSQEDTFGDNIKSKMESLRSAVPDNNEWMSERKTVDFTQMLSDVQPNNTGCAVITRPELDSKRIIEEASGGLAMRGIYLKSIMNCETEVKQTVIQLCSNITMKGPLLKQTEEFLEFKSREKRDSFRKSIATKGYKMKFYGGIGVKCFGIQMGISKLSVKDSDDFEIENAEETFISREKHAFVPVKCCELKLTCIRLTSDVIKELKEIERRYREENNCSTIISICGDFFRKYGSHVKIGNLHFGGIYKWIATYHSETKSNTESKIEIVHDALDGLISLGVTGTHFNLGVGVSGSHLTSVSRIDKKYSESELSNLQLKIEPDGGPPDECDFHKWKHTMTSQNSTWSLIDRDTFYGLWEILDNHQSDFKNHRVLSDILECSWNMEIFKSSLNSVDLTNCTAFLEMLYQTIEKLHVITDAKEYFKDLVQENENLSEFFDLIAKSDVIQEQINNPKMSNLLRIIIDSLKRVDFSNRPKLREWITKIIKENADFSSVLLTEDIANIDALLSVLNLKFLPSIRHIDNVHRHKSQQSFEQYITKDFTQVCQRLLNHFEVTHNEEHLAILLSLLHKLRYKHNHGFPRLLTLQDIEEFTTEAINRMDEYKQESKGTDLQKQAVLIDFLVTNITCDKSDLSEEIFDTCYMTLYTCLSETLKVIIGMNTQNVPYNWKQMQSDLLPLKNGTETERQIYSLPELEATNSEQDTKSNNKGCQIISDELISLVDEFKLSEYLPNKLKLLDAIAIRSRDYDNNIESVPWLLLQTIMMQNSSVYTELNEHLKNMGVSNSPVTQDDIEEEDECLIFSDTADEEISQVNPIDLIVAVFTCCSLPMKQALAAKMYTCRLAIPVVLPHEPLVFSVDTLKSVSITIQGGSPTSAADLPCNVLSFMRIGRPHHSKSKMINEILSEENHDTFFNQNSPLGETVRKVSDGLIETTFLLPPKKTSLPVGTQNQFMTLVFNLRGDALQYKRQKNWLSAISTGIVIVTTAEELEDQRMVNFVTRIQAEDNKIIFVTDAVTKTKHEIKRIAEKLQQDCEVKLRFVILRVKGQEYQQTNIINNLKKEIQKVCKVMPKKSILQIANDSVEEFVQNDDSYLHEKRAAEKTMQQISCKESLAEKGLLPLQSQLLHSLSQNMKKMFKPSEYKTQRHKAEIKNEISRIRREQLDIIPNVHPFMVSFLRETLGYLNTDTDFFMFAMWIKSALEANRVELKSEMKKQPLMFEHVLREIGQIYEVIIEQRSIVEQNTIDIAKHLPSVAAKLLLSGMPFELLNGDIVHVPMVWVKAVFTELEKIVGPKGCLILSIVGIQSSGKSTLLNTMFGLQFPVGHGRTTNGAFMQIIPVNDEQLPYRYVLIIDTEGLRAPELGDQNYLHDTEFATFIMGLADVNIVNIQGEHSTEMNEVLQMVVHALLRLRLTKDKMNTKQSCCFIYQKVHCEEENRELENVRQTFIEALNKNTKQAADALDITDIETFDQVIDFDEKFVWYLPNLWSGSFPMVHTDTNYSVKAAEIKRVLLYEIASNGKACFTFSQTSERIETIWSGILMEDFAFDFRNTLEVKAFTTMDRKYHELEWNVEYYMFQFVQQQKRELVNCEEKKESENLVKSIKEQIREELLQQSEMAVNEFESFIDQNSLKNIMMKWRQSFILKMDGSLKSVADRSEKEMHFITEEIEQTRQHNMDIKTWEEKINDKVKYYASELAGKTTEKDEKTLLEKFNSAWINWMTDFQTSQILKEEQISEVIKHLVLDMNLPIKRFLHNISEITYQDCKQMTLLEGSITGKDIQDDKDISRYKEITGYARKEKKDVCVNQAIGFTDKLFRYTENYCSELRTKDTGFNEIYMKKLLNYIKTAISDHNEHKNNDHQFKLLPPYSAVVLTHVTKYCIKEFTELDARYKQRHSPRARLEKYKDTAWKLFRDLVNSKSEDAIAATFFLKAIEESILEYLSDVIPGEVENEILKHFKHSKRTVMKTVMIDLVDKNDFHCFNGYISAPELYVQQWLFYYTNDTLFGKTEGSQRLYNQLCEPKVSSILEDIKAAVMHASYAVGDKFGSRISPWLDSFLDKFSQMPVSTEKFIHVKTRNVSDIQFFKQAILHQLGDTQHKLISAIAQTTLHNILWKRSPYKCIYERLWGCCENCPFCNEPCELANGHLDSSVKHSCQQHRPQGIGGFSSKESLLLTDVCNDLIQTDNKYLLHRSREELKYRHYRTKFPEWEISPSGNTSKYWMWFFNKYKVELARINNAEPPKLEKRWTVIGQKEALESLNYLDN